MLASNLAPGIETPPPIQGLQFCARMRMNFVIVLAVFSVVALPVCI
jgi:hypothetical protein